MPHIQTDIGSCAPCAPFGVNTFLTKGNFLFVDESRLSIELTEASNNAAALPSRDVSKDAMNFGILIKKILPAATVLGFSRSGKFINKEFLHEKAEVYTLVDVIIEDFQKTIQQQLKNSNQIKSIFKKLKQISLNQIFFVMKILEHQEENFENITTASDLFLTILRGNLAFHNQNVDAGFSQMLKGKDQDFFLKKTFQLCKENLQNIGKNEDAEKDEDAEGDEVDKYEKWAGVFDGTLTDEENWKSDLSDVSVPLNFLKLVGIFEIPPSSYEALTLTAHHLSFVEFFASVGILLSSDIGAELDKIENWHRTRAVCFYMRYDYIDWGR